MSKDYQLGFSEKRSAMFDQQGRERKAKTMVNVLHRELGTTSCKNARVLNVGGSAGYIDLYLAEYFCHLTSIDIDEPAIAHAQKNFKKENLEFRVGDALNLGFPDEYFDIVICSQVYEHVPDANAMMGEIFRTLKKGGLCYFAAGNRIMFNEPHYNLPLLSIPPKPISHLYLKLAGKGDHYYETHLSYWGLKRLVSKFTIIDYTRNIINNPEEYSASYMIAPNSRKARIASFICRYFYFLVPRYIWLSKKPS